MVPAPWQTSDARRSIKIPGQRQETDGKVSPAGHMDAMSDIHAVAVFCGSRAGNDPAYRAAAQMLGHGLAEAGIRLVYGGGRIGLMGIMADAAWPPAAR